MTCTAEAAPQVVVTRERGKNGKLMKALQQRGVTVLELPLVETAPGPDQERLPGQLEGSSYDWVVLTSPEAARVFVDGWQLAGRPQVRSCCSCCHVSCGGESDGDAARKHPAWQGVQYTPGMFPLMSCP